MAAIPQNKLTIGLSAVALAVVAFVLIRAMSDGPVKAGAGLEAPPLGASAPAPGLTLGAVKPGADADTPTETINTVVASTNDLKLQVQKLVEQNQDLKNQNDELKTNRATIVAEVREQVMADVRSEQAMRGADDGVKGGQTSGVVATMESAVSNAEGLFGGIKGGAGAKGVPAGLGFDGASSDPLAPEAARAPTSPTYKVIAPVGFELAKGDGGRAGLVRKNGAPASPAPEPRAQAMAAGPAEEGPEPYLTIPENATLASVTGMTALVGRVPIDGRVQDPMQFKAIIGRTNLAASGWELPEDLSGVIVTGIAVGDMALSCSEGRIISLTFVFDDGTIRTVSKRRQSGGGSSDPEGRLGHISDIYGNPCIAGKFVTNAPSYLTDIVGSKALSIGAKAYAAAQTSTSESATTGLTTSSVTGSRGAFVLGQTAGGAADELVSWLMRRLNNSFDAVVVPAGKKVVVHIEEEIKIDKDIKGRRLDHRSSQAKRRLASATVNTSGDNHGLD